MRVWITLLGCALGVLVESGERERSPTTRPGIELTAAAVGPAGPAAGAQAGPAVPESAAPAGKPRSAEERPGRARGAGPRTPRSPGAAEDFLTPEQISRVLNFTRENFPEVYERLMIAQNNPNAFRQLIHRVARAVMPILKVKADNPELAEKMIAEQRAQMAVEELAREYRATSNPQRREQLRGEIHQQVQARFEARLERMRLEIRNLQRRLDDAKQNLSEQESNKQKLIDDAVNSVTARPKGP